MRATFSRPCPSGKLDKIAHPWVLVTGAGTDIQTVVDDFATYQQALTQARNFDGPGVDVMKRLPSGELTTEF